jgi:hypothetical protein
VFGESIGNVFSDWGTPLDGSRSLKLYGQFSGQENYSGAFQNVAISGGSTITANASALIRSEDSIVGSANQALMKIEFYSQAGAEYGSESFLGESIATLADGASVEDVWLNQSLVATAPFNAVEARLAFVFVQPSDEGGAVFIDSAALFESLALPGDYNGDGMVNAADYVVWRDGGAPDSTQVGYDLWAVNYGATTSDSTESSSAVPEPVSMAMLGLGGLAAMQRRSRI